MNTSTWEDIAIINGELQAHLISGLLEAQGVPTLLSQEGAGRAYGLAVGRLGEIHILVPKELAGKAQQVLADYEAGAFADQTLAELSPDDLPPVED